MNLYFSFVIPTILIFVVFLVSIVLLINKNRGGKVSNDRKSELRKVYAHQDVFLCDGADGPKDGFIQLYGDLFGMSLHAGMKIIDPNGRGHIVKEVYADDEREDLPDLELPSGSMNTAIVVEAGNDDWASFKENIKRDGVVALTLH
ncbi:hypothetical protein HY967_02970 [Candidatus Jorgensenbacteria bacterium]|nr:hypothetical protein [Candidatus Jorgensenbacteria bacterium]